MPSAYIGKILIICGIILILTGIIFVLLNKMPFSGSLPGDIYPDAQYLTCNRLSGDGAWL